ncbi:MAG: GNAT family N-acetyltransferase [Clostridia bacterium]|nr:GNAT family N-acetyltransferase [Clostridia bacterium]
MDYKIEKLNIENVEYYARVNALAWKQSYKGIVNDDFLELINTEPEIQKTIANLKEGLNDSSRRFLIKYNDEYVGLIRVRKTKYDKYSECGELGALYLLDSVKGKGLGKILFNKAINELKNMNYNKMILGCLSENPSNDFYKHMGGELVNTNPLTLPNGQKLKENLYYYDI